MADQDWNARVTKLLQEQEDALADSDRRLQAARRGARDLTDSKLRPAFQDLANIITASRRSAGRKVVATFSVDKPQISLRVEPTANREPIDDARAELVVRDGPEPPFTYRLVFDVSPKGIGLKKKITPCDDSAPERVSGGLQEAPFSAAFGEKGPLQVSREDILADFFADYEAFLRSQRE